MLRSAPAEPSFSFAPSPYPALHWKGTSGACHVETPKYVTTHRALADAWPLQGIIAIIGDVGLGKTHDVGLAVRKLGFPVAYYQPDAKPGRKEFVQGALLSITETYNLKNTEAEMKRDLFLAGRAWPLVWVLDDVERAEGYGIEVVRTIWARPDNTFTIVLIGNDLMRFLDANKPLRDRVARWIHYDPMRADASAEFARHYHPVFRNAPAGVVDYLDAEAVHGVPRQWAHVVEVLNTMGFDWQRQRLTRAVATEAITRRFDP
jgi:hypothetical protein